MFPHMCYTLLVTLAFPNRSEHCALAKKDWMMKYEFSNKYLIQANFSFKSHLVHFIQFLELEVQTSNKNLTQFCEEIFEIRNVFSFCANEVSLEISWKVDPIILWHIYYKVN